MEKRRPGPRRIRTEKCRLCGKHLKKHHREGGVGYKGFALFCTATCGFIWAVRAIETQEQLTHEAD